MSKTKAALTDVSEADAALSDHYQRVTVTDSVPHVLFSTLTVTHLHQLQQHQVTRPVVGETFHTIRPLELRH